MKELFTEQQANGIVIGLSVLATLVSLGWGWYQSREQARKTSSLIWARSILFAFTGPVIWIFWGIYNSIENEYGLDSVKALEINFFIAIGIACFFMALYGWMNHVLKAPKHRRS